MTTKEFIETYTQQRAEEIQAEMLAQSSRRPKQWTFVEKSGEKTTEYTLNFDGCPFKLKSSKMVEWLWACLLSAEASTSNTESLHGFSADELLEVGFTSIFAQIERNFWVYEPVGLVRLLVELICRLENYEEKLSLIVWLKDKLTEKFNGGELPEAIYWNCLQAILLCSIYIMEISIKTGNVSDWTFAAMEQLRFSLDECVNGAKEAGEEPDFSLEYESFDMLVEMIPMIESSGNEEIIRWSYEFARDYYQATRRFTLADKFNSQL